MKPISRESEMVTEKQNDDKWKVVFRLSVGVKWLVAMNSFEFSCNNSGCLIHRVRNIVANISTLYHTAIDIRWLCIAMRSMLQLRCVVNETIACTLMTIIHE